jgi:Ca2+-binding EF-hand superfamily protein
LFADDDLEVIYRYVPPVGCGSCAAIVDDSGRLSPDVFCPTSSLKTVLLSSDLINVQLNTEVRLCAPSITGADCCSDSIRVQPIVEIHSIVLGDTRKATGAATITYTYLMSASSNACLVARDANGNVVGDPAGVLCQKGEQVVETVAIASNFSVTPGQEISFCVDGFPGTCSTPATVTEPEPTPAPPSDSDNNNVLPLALGVVSGVGALAVLVVCCRRGGIANRVKRRDSTASTSDRIIVRAPSDSTRNSEPETTDRPIPVLPESPSIMRKSGRLDSAAWSEFSSTEGPPPPMMTVTRPSLAEDDGTNLPAVPLTRSRVSMVEQDVAAFDLDAVTKKVWNRVADSDTDLVLKSMVVDAVSAVIGEGHIPHATSTSTAAFGTLLEETSDIHHGSVSKPHVVNAMNVFAVPKMGQPRASLMAPSNYSSPSILDSTGMEARVVDLTPTAMRFKLVGCGSTSYSMSITDSEGATAYEDGKTGKDELTQPINVDFLSDGPLHARFTLDNGRLLSCICPHGRKSGRVAVKQEDVTPDSGSARSLKVDDLTDASDLPADQQFVLDRMVSINRRALKRQESKRRRMKHETEVSSDTTSLSSPATSTQPSSRSSATLQVPGEVPGQVEPTKHLLSVPSLDGGDDTPIMFRTESLSDDDDEDTKPKEEEDDLTDVGPEQSFLLNRMVSINRRAVKRQESIQKRQQQKRDEKSASVEDVDLDSLLDSFRMLDPYDSGRVVASEIKHPMGPTLERKPTMTFEQYVFAMSGAELVGLNDVKAGFASFPIHDGCIESSKYAEAVLSAFSGGFLTQDQKTTLLVAAGSPRIAFKDYCVSSLSAGYVVRLIPLAETDPIFGRLNALLAEFTRLKPNASGRVTSIDVRQWLKGKEICDDGISILDQHATLSIEQLFLVATGRGMPGLNAVKDAFVAFPKFDGHVSLAAFRRVVERMQRLTNISDKQAYDLRRLSASSTSRVDFEHFCRACVLSNVVVRYSSYCPSPMEWREHFDALQKDGKVTKEGFLEIVTRIGLNLQPAVMKSLAIPAELAWVDAMQVAHSVMDKSKQSDMSDSDVDGEGLDEQSRRYDFLTDGSHPTMSFEDYVVAEARGAGSATGMNPVKANFDTFPHDMDGQVALGILLQQLDDMAKHFTVSQERKERVLGLLRMAHNLTKEPLAGGVGFSEFLRISRLEGDEPMELTYGRVDPFPLDVTKAEAAWIKQFDLVDWASTGFVDELQFHAICRYFGFTSSPADLQPFVVSGLLTRTAYQGFVREFVLQWMTRSQTERDAPSLDTLLLLFEEFGQQRNSVPVSSLNAVIDRLVEHGVSSSYADSRRKAILRQTGQSVSFEDFGRLLSGFDDEAARGLNTLRQQFVTFPQDSIHQVSLAVLRRALEGLVVNNELTPEQAAEALNSVSRSKVPFSKYVALSRLPALKGKCIVNELAELPRTMTTTAPGKVWLDRVQRLSKTLTAVVNCDGLVESIAVEQKATGQMHRVQAGDVLKLDGLEADKVVELVMTARNDFGEGEPITIRVQPPQVLSVTMDLLGLEKSEFGYQQMQVIARAIVDGQPELVSYPEAMTFVSTSDMEEVDGVTVELEIECNCLREVNANMASGFVLVQRSAEICNFLKSRTAFKSSGLSALRVTSVKAVNYPRVGRMNVLVRGGEGVLAYSKKNGHKEAHVALRYKGKESATKSLMVLPKDNGTLEWNHKVSFDVMDSSSELEICLMSKTTELLKVAMIPVTQLEPGENDLKLSSDDGTITLEVTWYPRRTRVSTLGSKSRNVVKVSEDAKSATASKTFQVQPGAYLVGTKRVFVRAVADQPMVRAAGGWLPLQEWMVATFAHQPELSLGHMFTVLGKDQQEDIRVSDLLSEDIFVQVAPTA